MPFAAIIAWRSFLMVDQMVSLSSAIAAAGEITDSPGLGAGVEDTSVTA
jgi:hypothetical protein